MANSLAQTARDGVRRVSDPYPDHDHLVERYGPAFQAALAKVIPDNKEKRGEVSS
ncbi:hypothetical protein [Bradyrhizobium sp. LHD-71]|uniref:hypothetical protein n=1 Tax=Bradyrhizobium sp. LHD-71 TaxID=3072141 RepID=UPI00280F8379|nr:hypothetical protein [Bradyrhizobium sp. LHD-71]MDQ8726380.1 hypothetical protein [Bradyrhizobium sp. LHD-71]